MTNSSGFRANTGEPGQIVIADRLGSHKVAGVREAIEARGAELVLLPPYSHDFNPIEQVFAKLKALLRNAEPRTRERKNQNVLTRRMFELCTKLRIRKPCVNTI